MVTPRIWMFWRVVMSITPTSSGYLDTQSAKKRICEEFTMPFGTFNLIMNVPGFCVEGVRRVRGGRGDEGKVVAGLKIAHYDWIE